MNQLIIGNLLFSPARDGWIVIVLWAKRSKVGCFSVWCALANQLFILPTAFSVLLDGQTQSQVVPFPFPIGRAFC